MRTSRVVSAGAVAAVAVGSVSLWAPAQAKAATTVTAQVSQAHPAISPVTHRAHMGSYAASRFASAAAKLPSGLAAQLRKQLGITPEQFLADGQAGADAGKVITSLRAAGVPVLGARLSGTTLTLTMRDAAGAAAAEADGARAVIGAAEPVKTVKARTLSSPADGSSPVLGGDFWFYFTNNDTGEGVACSVGFNGYDIHSGAKEFLTAGHCGDYQHTGDPAPADGLAYVLAEDTDPLTLYDPSAAPSLVAPLGSMDQPTFHFGGGADSGLVKVTAAKATPLPAVTTWGSGNTTGASSAPSQGVENSKGTVPVLAAAAAVNGEPICHSGARTGWQCGTVESTTVHVPIATSAGDQEVDSFATNVCDLEGDSGGSFVSGEYAIGVTSAGTFTSASDSGAGYNNCQPDPNNGFTFGYPMVAPGAGWASVAQSAPTFELAVSVPAPVVTTATANVVTGAGAVSGHLAAPFATGTRVSLSVDGHAKTPVAADSHGNWAFSLTGLAAGVHSYTVTAGSGHSTRSVSAKFAGMKAPGIRGTVKVGVKVTASPGAWPPAAPTYTYQWLASGKPISRATGASYTIPASLAGQKLSVTVTAHKSGYSNAVATSGAYPVAKGTFALTVRPKLSGTPQVGRTLAVTKGTWIPAPVIHVQWYANGKPIARATATSLKLSAALKGTTISVTVTASKAGYATAGVRLTESVKVRA